MDKSHPSRMCGLKCSSIFLEGGSPCRTLYGAWIKIVDMQYPLFLCRIPCGVWIKASYRKNT